MILTCKNKCRLFLFIVLIGLASFLQAQEIQTPFGKNRVQYSDDFDSWSRYETNNLIVYWYGKSRNTAISAMQIAETDFEEIQDIMEHRLNDKIELFVYGDVSELYQTNIGLRNELPNSTDELKLQGNKVFVYFDGNHQNLKKLVRKGLAKSFLANMLYGNSITEMVQNSVMIDIPQWFKIGLVDYIGEKWDKTSDEKFRQLFASKSKKIRTFRRLTKYYPKLAGHAFWHYIGQEYGHSAISNILYLARINRNIEPAFQYVLGEDYETVTANCLRFYENLYFDDVDNFKIVEKKNRLKRSSKKTEYQKLSLSDDGKWLLYSTNTNGRVIINLRNTFTGKTKKIKRLGYNNSLRPRDDTYPVLFWADDNQTAGIIFEKFNVLNFWIINVETGEKIKNTLSPIFTRVYSADFLDNKYLVISGNTTGNSDLFKYGLNKRNAKPITNDNYDDLDVKVATWDGKRGILFTSNRPSTIESSSAIDSLLSINAQNIVFKPFDSEQIIHLTNNSEYNSWNANIQENRLTYLTDQFGVQSIMSKNLNTNKENSIQLSSNILDKACHNKTCYLSLLQNECSYLAVDTLSTQRNVKTAYEAWRKDIMKNPDEKRDNLVDINNLGNTPEGWYFQSPFEKEAKTKTNTSEEVIDAEAEKLKEIEFNPARLTAARLRFRFEDIVTTLDNKPLFSALRTYTGQSDRFTRIPLGFLMKAQTTDIFEDYFLTAGLRIATNFTGYEAFMTYEDRKNKWDHIYGIYWKKAISRVNNTLYQVNKFNTNTLMSVYEIKYPFSEFFSLKMGATLRNDSYYAKITDKSIYNEFTPTNNQRIGLKFTMIYDNSSERSVNILHGLRAKVCLEGMNKFRFDLTDSFVFEPSKAVLGIISTDVRYYLPIFEKSVLAFRVSGGTSLGTERLLYFMGDVEGTLIQRFDDTTPIPNSGFAYRVRTPQMRGFMTNIRNGSSYTLSNIELRVPIFRYLLSDEYRFDFVREFQVVGFFDVGTAWYGLSPYSPENPINNAQLENPIISLDIKYYRDPIIMGYGWGLRTKVVGYFVKFDYAWGVDTKAILAPRMHFSIGTDF